MRPPDGRFRRTKIVATIGPASGEESVLAAMVEAGVDVVRVNSSHGTARERIRLMELARTVRERVGKPVAILVDLRGPRIRVGALDRPMELEENMEVVFAPEGSVEPGQIPTTYDRLARDVREGTRILLDDGLLHVEVTRVEPPRVHGRVRYGGTLTSHKGMNLPDVQVSAPSVTEKDRLDIALALEHGADFIGVSFVRRAEDLSAVRELVPQPVQLVAKIEKAAALGDLPRILEAADAIMVARGDLGVELPFEEVPLTQKRIITEANRGARAVITATQMLESMVRSPQPTRAEASDVANAILDGTDAVMLSAETAAGEYPVHAVRAMARIVREVERVTLGERPSRGSDAPVEAASARTEDAIAVATGIAAEVLDLPLIVCFTKSGFTARKIAAYRPRTPIVGLTTEPATWRQLALVWGVIPELARDAPTYEAMLGHVRESLVAKGYVRPGDQVAVTAGVPFDVTGTTNLLKIERL